MSNFTIKTSIARWQYQFNELQLNYIHVKRFRMIEKKSYDAQKHKHTQTHKHTHINTHIHTTHIHTHTRANNFFFGTWLKPFISVQTIYKMIIHQTIYQN